MKPDQRTPRPPMVHILKCHYEPFSALLAGEKTFEWRKFDRDFRVGDFLNLCEVDPNTGKETGPNLMRRVTYLISGRFGIPDEYCIMSLESANFKEGR